MAYLFLALSVFAGITKGFFGKKTSGIITGFKDSVLANSLRMVFCLVFGALIVLISGDWDKMLTSSELVPLFLISGVSNAVFVATWLISVKNGAYMMLDVALMMGTLIPALLSLFFYGEPITPVQWIGMGVLICATAVMCSYNNSLKSAMTLKTGITMLACTAFCGLADFSQKMFVHEKTTTPASVFNFYTYLVAAVILFVVFFFIKGESAPRRVISQSYIYILIMAIALFLNTWFKTIAADTLDSAILYPLYQGSALVLATIMSAVCFGEKLNQKAIIGLSLAFCGLIIMNI